MREGGKNEGVALCEIATDSKAHGLLSFRGLPIERWAGFVENSWFQSELFIVCFCGFVFACQL